MYVLLMLLLELVLASLGNQLGDVQWVPLELFSSVLSESNWEEGWNIGCMC